MRFLRTFALTLVLGIVVALAVLAGWFRHAVAVDRSYPRAALTVIVPNGSTGRAVAQLKSNQTRLAAKNIEIVEADALRRAASLPPNSFDVVFLDPPFGDTAMLGRALELAVPLVAPGGALYVESGEPVDPAQVPALAGWTIYRAGRAGAVHYHLLRRENDQ